MSETIHDFIAIGLGPFNLGLACLTSNIDKLDGLFLEQRQEFNWHPGLMLESAHLQTPFMSDLVTLADPTHPLSFLNYKKQQGHLYSFYIREDFFLMRREYNQYCRWAIEQLDNIRFNQRVEHIDYLENLNCYRLRCRHPRQNTQSMYYARKLILGTGPQPYVPDCARTLDSGLIHSADYLNNKAELQDSGSITIIGSGQSAGEIYYDLLQDIDSRGYELNWVTRAPRFFPLEYSKLTLEMTSPEYVDYFYSLPPAKRDELNAQQKNLYKGIDQSLINDIFDLLYVKRLNGDFSSHILTNAALTSAKQQGGKITLDFHHQEQGTHFSIDSEKVIAATGFQFQLPDFLQGVEARINWDEQQRFAVSRHYSIDRDDSIFVQNAELHTHGFVTPDLGMACYRNSCIIRELLGYEHYPIEKRIAFQAFGSPETLRIDNQDGAAIREARAQ